jgi:hypothetical protein
MWLRVVAVVVGVGISACGGSPRESGNAPAPLYGIDGAAPGATGGPAVDACVQARVNALVAISEVVARHATVCNVDGDCALVNASLPCQDNCETAVLAANVPAFKAELDEYGARACPTLPSGCGFSPSCAQIARARCESGRCRPAVVGASR